MFEDTETLAELLLAADQFCSKIEVAAKSVAPISDKKELRTKLGQCRTQLAHLQNVLDDDELQIENASVRGDFRHLIMLLMWVAFYARAVIDFRLFRRLVMIESTFTYLLNCR
jgi:hypothetical protein